MALEQKMNMNLIQQAAAMISPASDGHGWIVDPHVVWGYPDDLNDHSAVICYKFRDAWLNAFHYARWKGWMA